MYVVHPPKGGHLSQAVRTCGAGGDGVGDVALFSLFGAPNRIMFDLDLYLSRIKYWNRRMGRNRFVLIAEE